MSADDDEELLDPPSPAPTATSGTARGRAGTARDRRAPATARRARGGRFSLGRPGADPPEAGRAGAGRSDASTEPAAEPPDPEATARSRRRRLTGAVAVVVLALVTLGVLYPGRQVPPGAPTYDAGTRDPIEAALPVLRSFVERTRGLTFTGPVSITVLGSAQFASAYGPPKPAPGRAATERALGLATSSPPPGDSFYDYATHRIVLRSRPFDGYDRAVLVRELARALDDQRFDILRLVRAATADTDHARALGAVIDGDAYRVQAAYVATLPDRAAVAARLAPTPARDYATNVRDFPATFGRAFLEELANAGGATGVDAAFNNPPTSTAQVIEPRQYTQGVAPVGVRAPQAAGAVVDSGTLGRFGLAMLTTRGARVLNAGASASWQGDAYVTYRSGSGYCTRLSILVGDPQAQGQLRTDLTGAPNLRSLTLFGQDTVRAEFCGPA